MKYTKEQAQDFLKNKKVYVNGKSKEIQEKLFECGCNWFSLSRKIDHLDRPFLFIDEELSIIWGSSMNGFKESSKIEITAEDILSIDLNSEIKFKPFDKVLVRDGDDLEWLPKHFSDYFIIGNNEKVYNTIDSDSWNQCIPYEGNENLAFTNKSPEQC